MIYLDLIDQIISKLNNNGFREYAKEIVDVKCSSSTGSELLMSVTYGLMNLVKSNENLIFIKEDVDKLIEICNKERLILKSLE